MIPSGYHARQEDVMTRPVRWLATLLGALAVLAVTGAPQALAEDRKELDRNAVAALDNLIKSNTAARLLNGKAKAVLVFPSIVKAGLLFGGQMGNGTLLRGGKPVAHYNSVAASYGLQAGVQVFGYALFFMNDSSLAYLDKSDGWEIGVGPSIVVVDEGLGKSMTSTTISQDVYAFIFDQKGLMAGIGIQGSKISKLAD
jgi:lipid-binding SYLF domain-containing protein